MENPTEKKMENEMETGSCRLALTASHITMIHMGLYGLQGFGFNVESLGCSRALDSESRIGLGDLCLQVGI